MPLSAGLSMELWPGVAQALPAPLSFSPCTLNVRPAVKTPRSQFYSTGSHHKDGGGSGWEKLLLPCCPCALAWAALLLPAPFLPPPPTGPLGFMEHKRAAASLLSLYKEKLALSSGHVKGGFLLLRREGPTGEGLLTSGTVLSGRLSDHWKGTATVLL